ncbi:protein 5NUC-like [Lutzomyia longipalpis]|uniref:protein 5NUC-like n=1 Tax=Lutzomyia longipalpis TaxID=7200 RepID=UPI0024836E59|nr:protein 5NUC-like [Lutzomyia longipalpis]
MKSFVIILIFLSAICINLLFAQNAFNLTILHNNDIHGRFAEFDDGGFGCYKERCFGGVPRMLNVIREMRNDSKRNVLFLNAGDSFTGTPLFSHYKENITADMMNLLQPDAMTLGNHEFDFGTPPLSSFLNQANFPIVVTNLDVADLPLDSGMRRVKSSIIFEISGHKIGLVGYVTPTTASQTHSEVIFLDEVSAVSQEVRKLRAAGIGIIIALGHSGFEKDLEVARKCPGITLIVGGHSHTLLHNGHLSGESILSGYPHAVRSDSDGNVTLIVQAGRYGKFLGQLELSFNAAEQLTAWSGNTILLDGQQDDDALALVEAFAHPLREVEEAVVGRTIVHLDGHYKSCRFGECNMGNLITDAILDAYIASQHFSHSNNSWSDVVGVLLQSGSIRNSVEAGPVKVFNVKTILPYENTFVVVNVSGSTVRDALEYSVNGYNRIRGYGKFLQVSGLRIVYDLSHNSGDRVTLVEILCSTCKVPHYEPLMPHKWYQIIIPEFLRKGGDGFTQFQVFIS